MNSDIAYEMGKYLQNANFGTLGTNIFVGQIPSTTDGLYVIRASGSLNNYVPLEESVVDIYAKNTSAANAISVLEQIKRYIHRMHSTTIDNTYIYTMLVIGDVDDVQRDEEYDKIFKISVAVYHRDKSLIS